MNKQEYIDFIDSLQPNEQFRRQLTFSLKQNSFKRSKKQFIYRMALVCVTTFCLIVGGIYYHSLNQELTGQVTSSIYPSIDKYSNLSKFSIGDDGLGGLGVLGVEVHSIDEIPSYYPWEETLQSSYLPVYVNHYKENDLSIYSEQRQEQMKQQGLAFLEAMGLEATYEESLMMINDKYYKSGYFTNDDFKLYLSYTGRMRLDYTKEQTFISEQELLKRYEKWFNQECTISKQKQDTIDIYTIYPKSNLIQQSINYEFNSISIWVLNNQYTGITVKTYDLSECLGYYPVRSLDEVQASLNEQDLGVDIQDKTIVKSEIVYIYSNLVSTWIPYYRVYVESDGSYLVNNDVSLKYYRFFYEPAIDLNYIE